MSRKSMLVKNTAIILFGKVCTQLISYLLLPMYTTVLSTEEYGTVDLLITYVALIAPIITLQMESAAFRFLVDVRDDKESISRTITNSIACLCVPLCIFLAICGIVNCIIDYAYALPFAVCVIANALIVVFPLGVTGMLWATALAQLLGAVCVAAKIRILDYIDKKLISKAVIREMSRYSLPLLPNSLSWWIISVSDRTIVTFFIGAEANGILAVATKLATIVVNVFAVFNLSWTESVAVHIHDKDGAAYISEISNQCFQLFGSCGLALIMGCSVFFRYLVGPDFQGAYNLVPLLVIGGVLNVLQSLYGIIYIGLKDTRQVSHSSMMAAAINITIDLLLIKAVELYAAPISTICAMLFLSISRYIDVNRIIRVRLNMRCVAVLAAGYVITYAVYWRRETVLGLIWLVASLAFCVVWNRKILYDCAAAIKEKLKGKNQ